VCSHWERKYIYIYVYIYICVCVCVCACVCARALMGQVCASGTLCFLLVSLYRCPLFIITLPGRAGDAWEPLNKVGFSRMSRSIWQKYKCTFFVFVFVFQWLEFSDSENKIWSSLNKYILHDRYLTYFRVPVYHYAVIIRLFHISSYSMTMTFLRLN